MTPEAFLIVTSHICFLAPRLCNNVVPSGDSNLQGGMEMLLHWKYNTYRYTYVVLFEVKEKNLSSKYEVAWKEFSDEFT